MFRGVTRAESDCMVVPWPEQATEIVEHPTGGQEKFF